MSAEQKHTPEPWSFRQVNVQRVIEGAHGPVAYTRGESLTDAEDEANAARIVACVNACRGMADPAATIQRLRDFAQACAELWNGDPSIPIVNQARHALGELETLADEEAYGLRKQRDELLVAASALAAALPGPGAFAYPGYFARAQVDALRAAIAKVQPPSCNHRNSRPLDRGGMKCMDCGTVTEEGFS